jgi:hypothetical protein
MRNNNNNNNNLLWSWKIIFSPVFQCDCSWSNRVFTVTASVGTAAERVTMSDRLWTAGDCHYSADRAGDSPGLRWAESDTLVVGLDCGVAACDGSIVHAADGRWTVGLGRTNENTNCCATNIYRCRCRAQVPHGLTWDWTQASTITCDVTLQEKVVRCHLVTTEASQCVSPATFVNMLE